MRFTIVASSLFAALVAAQYNSYPDLSSLENVRPASHNITVSRSI